ncbi:hypothetical protein AWC11_01665 [Mycobacterium interjectum]|nr:hypothetical protein AWC11_01665 [Mycobacterium interjectum]
MARVARPNVDAAGVYAHLCRYFEDDLRVWVANINQAHPSGAPYPSQRIFDDLHDGRTVNVPTYAMPRSAMESAPWRPGPPIAHGPRRGQPTRIGPQRAIVTPDDQVTFSEDAAAKLWLEENGL